LSRIRYQTLLSGLVCSPRRFNWVPVVSVVRRVAEDEGASRTLTPSEACTQALRGIVWSCSTLRTTTSKHLAPAEGVTSLVAPGVGEPLAGIRLEVCEPDSDRAT